MSETRRKIGAEMKIRIKLYNGELVGYLTEGKEYTLHYFDGYGGSIIGDNGYETTILINKCAHLNGGSWEIAE